MKTFFRILLLLLIISVTNSCLSGKRLSDSKSVILPLSDSFTPREGSVIYGLPRTVFNVMVEMERTIEKPGPYTQFAGDLLGLTDVIQNQHESWSIESVTVKTVEELDPSEFYVISGTSLFQTNILSLRKEGLILDINPAQFNYNERQNGSKESDNIRYNSLDLGSDEYFQVQRDTVYKRMNVDSSFIRIPYIVEKKKKLSVDQLAEKAAKRLLELRDGMHMILTGEATVFPQNEAAINEINRLEKAYTELFTGKTIKETSTYSYQIIPQKQMTGKPEALFHFSEMTGPVTAADKSGKPVMIEFIPEKKTRKLEIINNPQVKSGSEKTDRLFYRVPDVVDTKISFDSRVLFDSRKLIYQFGEVIQLPENYIIGK